jgi:hypothetical protein
MWGGVLEPALEEREVNAGSRNDREFDWEGLDAPARQGVALIEMAAKKKPADDPKEDPEDDPSDDPLAADEELEELDGEDLEGDADEDDEDFPEVDDDLIDLDDEWDEQTEEERHDNPHKFYE